MIPAGGTVELAQLADIKVEDGPIQVIREEGQRFATVLANVEGRDLVGFVSEAQAAVKKNVPLPPRLYARLGWPVRKPAARRRAARHRGADRAGDDFPAALSDLRLAAPIDPGVCNVPFAAIGGIVALRMSGEFLSVPASVGFIALLGIAVLNGVVMVSYINDVLINYLNERRGDFTLRRSRDGCGAPPPAAG